MTIIRRCIYLNYAVKQSLIPKYSQPIFPSAPAWLYSHFDCCAHKSRARLARNSRSQAFQGKFCWLLRKTPPLLSMVQAVYLDIVNIDFTLFLSFSALCFSPTSGIPRKPIFYGPSYFDPNRWNMYILGVFLLFTANVWSRLPGATLVPEVFLLKYFQSLYH